MKHSGRKYLRRSSPIPLCIAGQGALGALARRGMYTFGLDDRGLLIPWHPLSLVLWILTAAVILWVVIAAMTAANFSGPFRQRPSQSAAMGHLFAALGVSITLVSSPAPGTGLLGPLWVIIGGISVPWMLFAAYCRLRGKQPPFVGYVMMCLFFTVHVFCHYQIWSSDPQLPDYLFALLGSVGLTFFTYSCAAFQVALGNRRILLISGLAGSYFCLVEMASTAYPWLYLGCAVWALTTLHALEAPPKASTEVSA